MGVQVQAVQAGDCRRVYAAIAAVKANYCLLVMASLPIQGLLNPSAALASQIPTIWQVSQLHWHVKCLLYCRMVSVTNSMITCRTVCQRDWQVKYLLYVRSIRVTSMSNSCCMCMMCQSQCHVKYLLYGRSVRVTSISNTRCTLPYGNSVRIPGMSNTGHMTGLSMSLSIQQLTYARSVSVTGRLNTCGTVGRSATVSGMSNTYSLVGLLASLAARISSKYSSYGMSVSLECQIPAIRYCTMSIKSPLYINVRLDLAFDSVRYRQLKYEAGILKNWN
ncbi:hypothetical protein P167DRAFT_549590 [Morchella conica CCBAS932]|uniref:Uncharacterized protein n=1 Tax=Morchella conica CCBAS932 TaxID=1392247 RepID=A0A3N4KDQ8_9PEZI|nr:hypothetical protein P167DRAFT_549590 [Morchella conica CCBAS932]